MNYLSSLNTARTILWCYFLWYATTAARCFDPSLRLWATSLGLSAIIGFGLLLSTAHAGGQRTELGRWQVIRLFLMPFCVSSFAALVKDKGYILIFSPNMRDNLESATLCAGFVMSTWIAKRITQATRVSP